MTAGPQWPIRCDNFFITHCSIDRTYVLAIHPSAIRKTGTKEEEQEEGEEEEEDDVDEEGQFRHCSPLDIQKAAAILGEAT